MKKVKWSERNTRWSFQYSSCFLSLFSFSDSCSFLISPRSAISVLRRVGLWPRGSSAWWCGHNHHGNVHHDDGPGTSHPAEVRMPRSSWQEDSHLRQPQRSAQVKVTGYVELSLESRSTPCSSLIHGSHVVEGLRKQAHLHFGQELKCEDGYFFQI